MDHVVGIDDAGMTYSDLLSATKHESYNAEFLIKQADDADEIFDGLSPLLPATLKGDISRVRLLFEHGADVTPSFAGELLLLACTSKENRYDLCKLLLEKGADCNFQNCSGFTPLHEALQNQPLEVIRLLIGHGADMRTGDLRGSSALHYASLNPRAYVIEFVLDQGFDIETCNGGLVTPLFYAVHANNLEGCKILLERGAIVNRKCCGFSSALALALDRRPEYAQRLEMVELLLTYEAIVNQEILTVAATLNNSEIKKALMRHLAKLDHLNLLTDEAVRRTIQNDDLYRYYYWRCSLELQTMKKTRIYDGVPMFRILLGSEREITEYAGNEDLVNALGARDYRLMFPIYFTRLKTRFYVKVRNYRIWDNALRDIILKYLVDY